MTELDPAVELSTTESVNAGEMPMTELPMVNDKMASLFESAWDIRFTTDHVKEVICF